MRNTTRDFRHFFFCFRVFVAELVRRRHLSTKTKKKRGTAKNTLKTLRVGRAPPILLSFHLCVNAPLKASDRIRNKLITYTHNDLPYTLTYLRAFLNCRFFLSLLPSLPLNTTASNTEKQTNKTVDLPLVSTKKQKRKKTRVLSASYFFFYCTCLHHFGFYRACSAYAKRVTTLPLI